MSEQESFEKWVVSDDGIYSFCEVAIGRKNEKWLTEQAWEAATAEANKRIEALEKDFDTEVLDYLNKIAELQAHINTLREALVSLGAHYHPALQATPAESLQAHDDELIEKCAKVADDDDSDPGSSAVAQGIAVNIRALKGEIK